MINNYLAILGMVTFISGRYLVRLLLKILGPRYIRTPSATAATVPVAYFNT